MKGECSTSSSLRKQARRRDRVRRRGDVDAGIAPPGDKVSECSGTGEWGVYPDDKAAKQLPISVCDGNPWEFGGSKAHPKMRRSVGNPDHGNFQTLSREE